MTETDEISRRLDPNGPHNRRTSGSPIGRTNTGLAVTFVNIAADHKLYHHNDLSDLKTLRAAHRELQNDNLIANFGLND